MSASANREWIGLRLDPLDVLFFRDGRPFDAAARVLGGLPNPQTLAGALRTALLAHTGFDFARFARAMRSEAQVAMQENRRPEVKKALLDGQDAQQRQWVVEARLRGPWLALD